MKHITLFAALATILVAGCGHRVNTILGLGGGSNTSTAKDCGCNLPPAELKAIHAKSDLTNYAASGANDANLKYGVATSGPSKDVVQTPKKSKNTTAVKSTSGKVTEGVLGLPFYPGSTASTDAPSLVSDDAEAKRVISYRVTKDDPKKVLEFYKSKILLTREGDSMSNGKCCGGVQSTMTGTLKSGAEAKMTANRADGKKITIVMVTVKTKKGHA